MKRYRVVRTRPGPGQARVIYFGLIDRAEAAALSYTRFDKALVRVEKLVGTVFIGIGDYMPGVEVPA